MRFFLSSTRWHCGTFSLFSNGVMQMRSVPGVSASRGMEKPQVVGTTGAGWVYNGSVRKPKMEIPVSKMLSSNAGNESDLKPH
jgi:hypothetical protein